jgi:hypothetical protein
MKFTISANAISIVMTSIITVLLIAHSIQAFFFIQGLADYVSFLDFDMERNLPTFYSVMAIEICALLLFIIYCHHRKQGDSYRWAWLGLVIIFAFLGLDEATKIHENTGDLVAPMVDAAGVLYFPWVLPYGIALGFLSIVYIPWLLSLPLATRIRFIIAAIVFLSGALGMEMLSAVYAEKTSLDSVEYIWTYTIEETLEMLGVVIFMRALIQYLHQCLNEITIKFSA